MSSGLDMSLDEIIAKKRPHRGGRSGPTRSGGISKRPSGPIRSPRSPAARPRPYGSSPSSASANLNAVPEGKILVSNLAYKVTEADLWELFTTMIGPVRQVNLNFDQSGRSKGTASVVFSQKTDALRSVEKLRNITLDGREMKIEIVVAPNVSGGPISQRIGGVGGGNAMQQDHRSSPSRGGPSGARGMARGGRGGRIARGGRGGRRTDRPAVTREELDAEIGEYMQIDEGADSNSAQANQ